MNQGQLNIEQAPFLFLSNHPNDYFRKLSNAKKSSTIELDQTIIKDTFLSFKNFSYINNEIKRKVYESTVEKYIVLDQTYEHVHLIMIKIYNENSHISDINILNKLTIDFCSKTIVKEIKHKQKYLKLIYSKPTTMPEPENCSLRGRKTVSSRLESKQQPYNFNLNKKNVDVYSRTLIVDEADKYCGFNPLFDI